MRVLIVDDEELARIRLTRYLGQKHPAFTVETAEDGFEALEKIPEFKPDLVFLDIEMPELSGFDVLMALEKRPFRVIFQTAYDEFAVRAFEQNACDYILKPFTDERLAQSLAKAGAPPPGDPLAGLERALNAAKVYMTKIVIKAGSRSRLIDHRDVLGFLSEDHATKVVLPTIEYAYDHSLTFLEERLDPRVFLRIHRNGIVNLHAIKGTETSGKRTAVTLSNGLEVAVSRERKKALAAALETL